MSPDENIVTRHAFYNNPAKVGIPCPTNPSKVGLFKSAIVKFDFFTAIRMIRMDNISNIVMRRSAPGILIFNEDATLAFFNAEAADLLVARPSLDREARALCDRVRVCASVGKGNQLTTFCGDGPPPGCALRAFMLGGSDDKTKRNVVVLVEKVVEQRNTDFESVKTKFGLSKREIEVLILMYQGLGNRALSERLFITEQTVKDHIKHIMRKTSVNSRAALIAALR
jgi:DNA-binding CsgD family transcriptional regulator